MSRKFITQREINFIDNVTKELLQGVVEEVVNYYSISIEKSDVNQLYQESIHKIWNPPVGITALVLYDQGPSVAGRYNLDSRYTMDVYFHKKELTERNVVVREGDFVEYGGIYFEITSATQPQVVFGQINNKVMTKCTCVPAREGQFAGNSNSDQNFRTEKNIENRSGTSIINEISTDATPAFNPFRMFPTGSVG